MICNKNPIFSMQTSLLAVVIFIIIAFVPHTVRGHGRLIEPPSRASAWRYGFNTPPDYNDHELYCGGFTRQWRRNEGKCGVCGDAWDLKEPRPHENGGQWGQGVIVRKYLPSTEITIRVELTASHMGYFEFRLCPDPNANQECLDKYLLKILGGSPAQPTPTDLETRFYPRNGSRIYEIRAQLPDLKCAQCVLQWRYIAGNNWGMCPDGNGAVGCGPQEEFRSCSDIAIGEGAHTPIRPMRPTTRPTTKAKTPSTSTESTEQQELSEGLNTITAVLIALFAFLLLAAAIAWYAYRYHGEKLKSWLSSVANRFCWKLKKDSTHVPKQQTSRLNANLTLDTSTPKTVENEISARPLPPPVPPPRVKRQARVTEISPNESSIA